MLLIRLMTFVSSPPCFCLIRSIVWALMATKSVTAAMGLEVTCFCTSSFVFRWNALSDVHLLGVRLRYYRVYRGPGSVIVDVRAQVRVGRDDLVEHLQFL